MPTGLHMSRWLPAVATSFVVTWLATADAANLDVVPSITLDGCWNSNVLNAPENEVADYLLRATPALALSIETQGATVSLSGGLEGEWYAEREELNRTQATTNINLTSTAPVRVTPRFSVHPGARFVETRDAVRRNELSAAPIPGLPPSETLVTARTTVREYSGTAQFAYSLTPNVELGFGGGGLRREYPDRPPGLFGSRTITGNVSLAYRLTPRFSAGIFGNTSYDSYDGRPNARTYTGGLTGNYAVSERLVVDARGGATYLRQSTGIGDERNDEWSPYGRLSVTFTSRDFRAMLVGSYELAGGGSLGLTTKREGVVVTLADRFTPRWGWEASASVQSNRSTDPATTENVVTGSGSARISYQAAQWASLHLGGDLFRQHSRGAAGEDISQGTVRLGVTLSDVYNIF